MLEARVLHLINGDIDGELGPREAAELSSILEASAEARAMHAELRQLVERMEALPEREPPAGLAGRILAQTMLPARLSATRSAARPVTGLARAAGSYLAALLASLRPAQAGFAFAAGLLLTVGFYEATQRNGEPLDLSRMVGAMVADPAGASAQQQGTLSLSAPGLSGTVRRGAIGEFTVLSFDLESAEQTEIVVGFAEAGLAFGGIAYTSATGSTNNESYEVSGGTLRVVNQGRQMFSVFLPQVADASNEEVAGHAIGSPQISIGVTNDGA
jgi:hypothetical protein